MSLWISILVSTASSIRPSFEGQDVTTMAGVPVLNHPPPPEKAEADVSEIVDRSGKESSQYFVKMKEQTSVAQEQSACEKCPGVCIWIGKNVKAVEFRGSVSELNCLLTTGAAVYAEPDTTISAIPISLESVESEAHASTWGLRRIGAEERGGLSGRGVAVYVFDTGVLVTHTEFDTGRAAPALDVTGDDVQECAGNLKCAQDASGHGTHCAGTAAGRSVGVAPEASVRAVKVLNDNNEGSAFWLIEALDWLASSGERPAVGSLSLGSWGRYQSISDAIDTAVSSSVTIVVSAGNSAFEACAFSPAFAASAITVGAINQNDAKPAFSNYGDCVNMWAPGTDVNSSVNLSDSAYSRFSGTSMACPHVAGAAALVLELDDTLTPAKVRAKLINAGEPDKISGLFRSDTNVLLSLRALWPWDVLGQGCKINQKGTCVRSKHYRNGYKDHSWCLVTLYGEVSLVTKSFKTEASFDQLRVGSKIYHGTQGPPNGTYSGTIEWLSRGAHTKRGWKICRADRASPPDAPTPDPPTPANEFPLGSWPGCGTKRVGGDVGGHIVGGEAFANCSWPWQIAIVQDDESFCGGTLIAPSWVLTAAHCWDDRGEDLSPTLYKRFAVAGMHDRRVQSGGVVQKIRVAEGRLHSLFDPWELTNDIALLLLETPFELNECVKPACLPEVGASPAVGSTCWITGWGTLQPNGPTPHLGQEASVVIKSNEQCQASYEMHPWYTAEEITEDMLCANGVNSNGQTTDACQGDSGGPLVCADGDKWIVQGVTSWGEGCAKPDYPGVWARVAHPSLRSFIEQLGKPLPPPQPANPLPDEPNAGSWELISGDGCVINRNCISSKNYPDHYGNDEECLVNLTAVQLRQDIYPFELEDDYDFLYIDDPEHGGEQTFTGNQPSNMDFFDGKLITGTLRWTSDFSYTELGWKLCRTDGQGVDR